MGRVLPLLLVTAAWFFGVAAGTRHRWVHLHPTNEVREFLSSRVTPKTRFLYHEQLVDFFKETRLGRIWNLLSNEIRDNAVSHYMVQANKLHEQDPSQLGALSRTQCGYLLSSLRFLDPACHYPVAHKVFAAWRAKDPPKSAYPLTLELTEGLAGIMCMAGHRWEAICLLLCFSALLMVGEALMVRWEHVFLPESWAADQRGSIYIPHSKTGYHQYVPLLDPGLVNLLRYWKNLLVPAAGDFLFNFAYNHYRNGLLGAIRVLRLNPKWFRSHSARRGGATKLLFDSGSVDLVLLVGRWSSIRAARTYIRKGEALMAKLRASQSAETEQVLNTVRAELIRLLFDM